MSSDSAPRQLARRFGRRLGHRVGGAWRERARRKARRGGILMYHRVADERCDPWALCVAPQRFDEQMAVLAQRRAALDLAAFAGDDAFSAAGERIAVTFDDGYVDNVTAALPVLERHGIPATIFVVGHAIGRTREFWWDALQRALLESGPLPGELVFPYGSGPSRYRLDEAPGEWSGDTAWRADEDDPQTPRQRLFLALWEAIVMLAPDEQDAAVDHLLAWAAMPVDPPAGRLPASPEQFAALARHPLVTIGSHTLDHVSLPDLSAAGKREQIEGGHRAIEALVGGRVDRFSFPFGRLDAESRALVRGLGVDVACTSAIRAATVGDDRRELPRLQVTDLDGEGFARWLADDHALLTHAAHR